MPIRKRGDGWQVDVFAKGKRIRHQFTGTKQEAKQREMEIRLSLLTTGTWEPPTPTQETLAAVKLDGPTFLKDALPRAKSVWRGVTTEAYAKQAEAHIREVLTILGVPDLRLDDFGFEEIAKVVSQWRSDGLAPATIQNKLAALSKLYRVSRAQPALTTHQPDFSQWRPKGIVEADRVLAEDEEEKLIAWCQKEGMWEFLDLCIFGLDLGLHSSEALALKTTSFSGLDGKEPVCHVLGTKTEYRSASLPMTPRVVEAARRRIKAAKEKGTTLLFPRFRTSRQVCTQWDRFRGYMGLQADRFFTFKMLRHTCGTRLDELDVNAIKIRDFMRHGDLSTTSRYIHGSKKRLRHLADGLAQRGKEVVTA